MTRKKSKQKGKVAKLTKAVERFSISEPGTSQSSATTSTAPSPPPSGSQTVVASTSAAPAPVSPTTPSKSTTTSAVLAPVSPATPSKLTSTSAAPAPASESPATPSKSKSAAPAPVSLATPSKSKSKSKSASAALAPVSSKTPSKSTSKSPAPVSSVTPSKSTSKSPAPVSSVTPSKSTSKSPAPVSSATPSKSPAPVSSETPSKSTSTSTSAAPAPVSPVTPSTSTALTPVSPATPSTSSTRAAAAASPLATAAAASPSSPGPRAGETILSTYINPQILAQWPKVKNKVPPVFLHRPVDFAHHVKKVLNNGIKFYQPNLGKNYTKILCESFNDHKHLTKYFEKKQLPYHTFGHPSKRKMKVIIRGLPKEVELYKVKTALKSVSVPVIRVHKMYTKEERKDNTILVLVVVPYDESGKVLLKLSKLLGHKVTIEPPFMKPKQCYRCQKWGHAQRYCHGQIKCVKCAGEHWSKQCERDPEKEPPKCANCNGEHTASYRDCLFTPGSTGYELLQEIKIHKPCYKPLQLVTQENYETLYRNVEYGKTPARE